MSESVIETTPTARMEAMEENLEGHVSFLQRRLPGMAVTDLDGLLVIDSGLSSDTFNKILGARLDESSADDRIDKALSYFREAGRPFSFWVGPGSRPLDLEERLHERGLRAAEYELGMSIELDRIHGVDLPAGAEIRKVESDEDLAAFSWILASLVTPPDAAVIQFFELGKRILLQEDCPMRFYVAWMESEPAAVSELFLGGGVAGVHMVATAARYRRRGLGMALTWTALEEGRRAGMKSGVLQASAEGQPVYERLGFEPCGRFVEYAPQASGPSTD
jgi:ribosomal protein S18 acetylase RimI-like enzyme